MSRKEDRTPEERERARLEREARRAAREGRPPPAALPPDEIPPPPLEARSEPESDWDEPEERRQDHLHEPEPEPHWHEPEEEPEPPARPDWEEPEPTAGPDWEEPEPEPAGWSDPPHQSEPAEPNGSRLGEPWQASSSTVGHPPSPAPRRPAMPPPFQPGAQRRPVEPPTGYTVHRASGRRTTAHDVLRGRRGSVGGAGAGVRSRRWLIPVLLALGAIGLAAGWFLISLYQPFGGEGEGQVQVVIPRGAGVGEIADLLEAKGVISSPFFFKTRATISGRGGDLKAGTFRLRKDMSHVAALDALAQGAPPDVVRVTIPEGRSRREVKGIVAPQLKGDYLALTTSSSQLDPRRYGAKRTANLEGFLFPATYDLKRGRPLADLVAVQLRAFKREFAKVDLRGARRKNLTPYDVLTIASMVDREAQVPRERRIIASVIYNRLRDDIPLGIDATIRFATNNWTRPLRESQLRIDSPYNTRARRGLPPGPIGSPGLAAIRAAANPANTGFLYYVVKPGTCGEHAFTRTYAKFEQDRARYNTERSRRGGKSPTNC